MQWRGTADLVELHVERNYRFLEEALELVQSLGCIASEAHQLVDYVFGLPNGDVNQEMGGKTVTLAALANCHDIDMNAAGETELACVLTKIDVIRAEQAAKPKHSAPPTAPVQGASISPEALTEFIHNYDFVLPKYIATNPLHHFDIISKIELAKRRFAGTPYQPQKEQCT